MPIKRYQKRFTKMRAVSVILLVFVAAVATAPTSEAPKLYDLKEAPKLFEQFIKDNDKHYKDEHDKQVHFEEFRRYLKDLNEEIAADGQKRSISPFADVTLEDVGIKESDLLKL